MLNTVGITVTVMSMITVLEMTGVITMRKRYNRVDRMS